MINTKKLIKMARKWQNVAAIRRKRISLPRSNENSNSTTVADKGHFVIYTADRRRFEFPIVYLNNYIFRELFRISEEEFGIPCDGPIIFPCDAIFMEYVVSLIQKRAGGDMEKALLMSMATCGCSLLFLWWRVVVCGGISMAGRVVSSFSWTTQWYESFKWLHRSKCREVGQSSACSKGYSKLSDLSWTCVLACLGLGPCSWFIRHIWVLSRYKFEASLYWKLFKF